MLRDYIAIILPWLAGSLAFELKMLLINYAELLS